MGVNDGLTDAVRTLLGVAFLQMNLHRVSLRVDSDNLRAVRCYEKAGFQCEGTLRENSFRDGEYIHQLVMAILDRELDGET